VWRTFSAYTVVVPREGRPRSSPTSLKMTKTNYAPVAVRYFFRSKFHIPLTLKSPARSTVRMLHAGTYTRFSFFFLSCAYVTIRYYPRTPVFRRRRRHIPRRSREPSSSHITRISFFSHGLVAVFICPV